jgi:hypothetical protein
MGVFSELNNLIDISLSPEYATLCGFTQAELEKCYTPFIEKFSQIKGTDREGFLKSLRDEYDGFSFDGKTRVYNPYSIYRFMRDGVLDNYWMKSGSDSYLRYFLTEKSSFLVDYSGFKVGQNFAEAPGEIDKTSPEGFLYQAGYLTLRKDGHDKLSLDYPNGEVRKSMAKLSVLAMMDDSVSDVEPFFDNLSSCLKSGDPKKVFEHFREVMSGFKYQSLFSAAQQLNNHADMAPLGEPPKKEPEERIYQIFLQNYFTKAGVLAKAEESGNLGRADLVVRFLDKTYVIELKMAKDNKGPLEAAQAGLDQIREKNYAGRYNDPIRISLGLDKDQRNALACVFAIGNKEGRLIIGQNGEVMVHSHANTEAPGPEAKTGGPSLRPRP